MLNMLNMLNCPEPLGARRDNYHAISDSVQAVIRGPGLIFVLPFLEKVKRVDTRTQVFEVPPQQILSTDSVTLTVDAVIYYRVFDPVRAACKLQDYNVVSIR